MPPDHPLVGSPPPGGGAAPDEGPARPIPPEVMARMLDAARESLFAGRYQEAIAAYQAVLKRDDKNVNAMTHLALIVAIGGHADAALETWERAIRLDPDYAPAYLFRGQVLYEVKQDYAAAARDWERFVTLVPSGEEHDRVKTLLADARGKASP
jgi:tetratricopeptide (TPR) repeat protein